ncbi:MAG TPA: type IV toxin-antitoxin system AbiEi family antitoxin domain-containing protein [Baekduia sp.]|nr:type IV toxin-antitoxin system AbiEi family antitoxin domain-containing protein [Baekduia sp.]
MEHPDTDELWVRRLAEAQHGVLARRQLLDGGMSSTRVRSWVANGRLVRRRRGVYTMGHGLLSREGQWMAAVLACGTEAVLSRRSAAALWGIRPASGGKIDVTVRPDRGRRPGDDIRRSESGIVFPRFATVVDGIPVTTVAWTLLDLAAVLRPHQLRRAVEAADSLELFDLGAMTDALEADAGRPGSPALLALLADMKDHGVTRTRSDVEAAMLQLCLDHALPRPQVNHHDNGTEVDFRWPASRLIVEVDGWSFHRSRRAFVGDRARDRRALRAGWRVARYPALEVMHSPGVVAAELAQLLRG